MRGRAIRLSIPRRLIIDMLHFAAAIPTIPVQRRIDIASVVAARAACRNRPRWTAIFAKGYALVAREFPELRRAYIEFPWAHLYEYPTSAASIAVLRDYQGESVPFTVVIKDPAGLSLTDLGHSIQHVESIPIMEVKHFRRALRFGVLPRPIRRLFWWVGLNWGRQRANYFGTFGLSVYSALKAESLHPITLLTTLLNYGVILNDGTVDVRIIYDHRVMDGATVARALARLEEILNTEVAEEIRSVKMQDRSV